MKDWPVTMKRVFALIITAALFILSLGVMAAQDEPLPNDPNVNEAANACLEGGTLAGKCWEDADMWNTGWYLIRYQYGMIDRDIFPDQHKWSLPSLAEEEAAAAAAAGACEVTYGGNTYTIASDLLNYTVTSDANFHWHGPTSLHDNLTDLMVWEITLGWQVTQTGDCSPLK